MPRPRLRSTGRSFLAVGPAALLILLLAMFLSPGQASGSKASQYAGIETCSACHEDLVASFRDSRHGKKGFARKSDRNCEACHGPGGEHAEAGGDKSKIMSIASLSAEQKSEICLQCHETGSKMFWSGSGHESRGLSCQECHSVHSPQSSQSQIKAAKETDLCFSCHKRQASQFLRASHHPLREGQVSCSDCHNPHGGMSENLISADSTTEKCYECHAEKRGPFLWEHMPAREDCGICHDPHGSNHIKLLNAKLPFLCQRCHSDTRHPGTLYDLTAVNSNRLFDRSCTSCHSTIHGSNHPSGHTFLR